ncbi:DNA cytosine methyltransferase [Nitratireductor alexandrii]|uniref:DNA cytosine methyltransferase n=1 Tax=Nitratireductor alexandrii TaxID=2448161 RepID=UPI000FDBA109|nr:DNA cytosine methyltransferase [Nitratireductor alexandrii]
MRSVEMFSGCGGLALGLARAGFDHLLLVERDKHSVENVRHNISRNISYLGHWQVHSDDVRVVRWSVFKELVDFVAGGPPCQPFSIGGLHRGEEDVRDMWPEAIRAVRQIVPRGFLFENVRGLLRPKFADHLDWIRLSLTEPNLVQRKDEDRASHLERLRGEEDKGSYRVIVTKVNAADYGAPQKRHRVLFMGIHKSIAPLIEAPKPTHSRERLLWDQYVTGDYWRRHDIRKPPSRPANVTDRLTVDALRNKGREPVGLPWVTVRDALAGLGEPGSRRDISNHQLQPGARAYPGHTGSPVDEPAKALKAGVHGVPGGENMMAFSDGSVRYFTVREAARLQGLPDDYEFIGSWTENMRQLGNAAPVQLAEAFGRHIEGILSKACRSSQKAA